MSLEQEFLYYSNRLQNKHSPSDSPICDQIFIESASHTYLNVKVVLSKDLLEEINTVSQTMGATPEVILANYLQYGEDICLTPIQPEIPLPEDLDYDVTYLLQSYDEMGIEE